MLKMEIIKLIRGFGKYKMNYQEFVINEAKDDFKPMKMMRMYTMYIFFPIYYWIYKIKKNK